MADWLAMRSPKNSWSATPPLALKQRSEPLSRRLGSRPADKQRPLDREAAGMPRPIWRRILSFGLLNVPVSLMSGERRMDLSFRMGRSQQEAHPIRARQC